MKFAYIESAERSPLATVERYLPSAYVARQVGRGILIMGEDVAGWTLTNYVIPRLASGLHFAREIDADEAKALVDGAA